MNIEPKKPSDLVKDDEVEFWERQIELSEEKLKEKSGDMRDRKGSAGKWRGLINFYKGDQWREGQGGQKKTFDRITANQAKSNIDSIRPQLYFQNPRIQISLKNPQLAERDYPQMGPMGQPVMQQDPQTGQPMPVLAIRKGQPIAQIGGQIVDAQTQVELIQAIDNYVFTETKAKSKIRRIINDALILPYGVAKWEWIVVTEQTEETNEKGEPTGEQIETVTRQYARLSRVKPWQFLWDSELDEFDIEAAAWVAEIKYLSEEEIKADKSLTGTDTLPEPAYYVGDEARGHSRETKPEEIARYKVYEIHDLRHGEFLVWIEGSDKINRKESPSPYEMVEGSIYTVLGFDDVPDDSYPLSTIDAIKSKGEAYNKVISYMVNHVARFNRKYRTLKGNLDESEMEKWERGEDGVTVTVKDMASGPEPISDAPIQTDAYNVATLLKREIVEDIGVTSMNKGTRETGVDTAYEASLIQGGADIKIQEKRDIVRQFCCDIIRKLNQILKAHADTEQVVKVVGQKGEQWMKWKNTDIEGEYIEDVDIYSTLPFSEELEKKQAMELLSLAGGDPYFNPVKVRQQVVRIFKWPENLLYNEQELAAMQQQQQQQQMMAERGQMKEAQAQQSRNMRPTGGKTKSNVQTGTDLKSGMMGQARNRQ